MLYFDFAITNKLQLLLLYENITNSTKYKLVRVMFLFVPKDYFLLVNNTDYCHFILYIFNKFKILIPTQK